MASDNRPPSRAEVGSTREWLRALTRFYARPLRWARNALIVAVVLVATPPAFTLIWWFVYAVYASLPTSGPRVLEDGSVNAAAWLGFAGNIFGALIGGLAAVLVLRTTIRHERKSENDRRLREHRVEPANQLSDLMVEIQDPNLVEAGLIRSVTSRALGLGRRINATAEGQVKPSVPNEVMPFSNPDVSLYVALEGLHKYANDLNDKDVEIWLREDLARRIEELSNAIVKFAGIKSLTQDENEEYGQASREAQHALARRPGWTAY